jgi:hypothetical protein
MTFQFSKFEGRNCRFEDRITISKSNSIGFPSRFYADNKIASFKYIVLFWDEKEKAIGISFSNDESEKSKFTIVKSEMYGGMASAKSFFTQYKIDSGKYRGRYEWEKFNQPNVGELFVIRLKEHDQTPSL